MYIITETLLPVISARPPCHVGNNYSASMFLGIAPQRSLDHLIPASRFEDGILNLVVAQSISIVDAPAILKMDCRLPNTQRAVYENAADGVVEMSKRLAAGINDGPGRLCKWFEKRYKPMLDVVERASEQRGVEMPA